MELKVVRVRVGEGGRIVIPAEFRKALGVCTGDPLNLSLEGNEIHVFTPEEAIRQAQTAFRRYIPEGRSLVEELIAERRAEAANE